MKQNIRYKAKKKFLKLRKYCMNAIIFKSKYFYCREFYGWQRMQNVCFPDAYLK